MKLLVDARTGWGHGIGRVVTNTVPRVARLRPSWQVDALVPTEHVATAEQAFSGAANIRVVACSVSAFSLDEQLHLSRYAQGYDLTWFTNYWVPLGWKGRFAVTVHDMLHLMPDLLPASWPKRMLARQTFAKVRRQARAVMFDSRFTADAFERMVGKPRVGVVVPLGGDHLDYGVPRPVGARTRRLLVVAASKKHKNFALLFDAWRRAQVADHWILTVVSPSEMLRTSVDLNALTAQEGRIDVRRGISNAELAALYADTAVLLMPSLYEGFGLPLLEGMLAGALCISSSAGSMVEIAEGAFVQFVNGRDLPGWTHAIEAACTIMDRGDLDLAPLLDHNVEVARRFCWASTAEEVAAVLERAA